MTTGLRSIGQGAIGAMGAGGSETAQATHKAVFAPHAAQSAKYQMAHAQNAVFDAAHILCALAAQAQTATARFQTARHIHIRLIVP